MTISDGTLEAGSGADCCGDREVNVGVHDRLRRAETLLVECGAREIEHPGGNLFAHLERVAALLGDWGADDDLRLAGLGHAFYGTDGFAVSLLALEDRTQLAEVIGDEAEQLVYIYASCNRRAVYPLLGEPGPMHFTDRFTGETRHLSELHAAAFVELTVANELDIAMADPSSITRWGAQLFGLCRRARERLSEPGWQTCVTVLARFVAN
ncbi:MAG: DUF6817 domain-containing protein [Acidimicrobiales bacterium]